MRVTNNFDDSILVEMNDIMNSEEYKKIFSPLVKSASGDPNSMDHLTQETVNTGNKLLNKDMNSRPQATNVRNLDQSELGPRDTETPETAQAAPSNIKSVLTNIAQGINASHAAAAQAVLSGKVNPGAGQVLLSYFKSQNPRLTSEQLEQQFKSLKTASVSSIIPVILKVANTLGALGYTQSEAVADRLIQSITVEAKAKVVEKNKGKETSKIKCKQCGGKCDAKGKCDNSKCKGKCGTTKRTY